MGQHVVILKGGEYDIWRQEELRKELDAIQPAGTVVLDLKKATFMDAGAIGLLVHLRKRLRDSDPNARLVLRNTPPIVMRVLKISQTDSLFDFAP